MPHVMKGNDQSTKRKMKQRILEAADFTFSVHIYEEFCPDARLDDVRDAGNKKADDGKFCNCQLHVSVSNSTHDLLAYDAARDWDGFISSASQSNHRCQRRILLIFTPGWTNRFSQRSDFSC